jgi:hypothetical protein
MRLGNRRQCRIIHHRDDRATGCGTHCQSATRQKVNKKCCSSFLCVFCVPYSAGILFLAGAEPFDALSTSCLSMAAADGFADAVTVLPETDFQFDAPRFYDLSATDEGHDEYVCGGSVYGSV